MANITGFRIDTDVTFSFDTGGAVPPPSGGGIAFSAALKTRSVKGFASSVELKTTKIPVDVDDLERGDISSSGGNISSNYYLRFKSSAKYELPEGALSVRATVVTAASASSLTPRFGIAWYDANDIFLSISYFYSNSQWVMLPANANKVRYTISWTVDYGIIPEQIESMLIETM